MRELRRENEDRDQDAMIAPRKAAASAVTALFFASAIGAVGIAMAGPASAGCVGQVFAQYCDGPIKPDGTWDRCMEAYGTTNAFGATLVPTVSRCYPYDPANPPMTPLSQPGEHIYP
jgi:hypothetical protein